MNINKFEELIKSAFERYRPETDNDAIWANIEPHLKKKKRRAFIIFFWGLGLGILMLLLWKTGWKPGERLAEENITLETSGELTSQEARKNTDLQQKSANALMENPAMAPLDKSASSDQVESTVGNTNGKVMPVHPVAITDNARKNKDFGIIAPYGYGAQNQSEDIQPKETSRSIIVSDNTLSLQPATVIQANAKAVETSPVAVETPKSVLSSTEIAPKLFSSDTIKPNTLSFPDADSKMKTDTVSDKKDDQVGKIAKNDKKKPDHRKSSKKRKFQWEHDFGIQTGPAFAVKQLKEGSHGATPSGHLEGRKATERSLESFTAGVFYSGANRKGLMLKTGLEYRQSNEKFHLTYNTKEVEQINGVLSITVDNFGSTIEQTTGSKTVTTTTEYSNTAYNHYRYVNFPIGLGYRHSGKKSRWELSGGLDMNLFFRAKGTVYNLNNVPTAFEYGTTTYESMFTSNPTGMGLWGSYAYDWKLTDKLRWQLSANAQVPLGRISSPEYKLIQRYFNFGVQAGVFYQVFQEKKGSKKH